MLMSLACFNLMLRRGEGDTHILPRGLAVSLLTGLLIFATSFLGGRQIYEQAVGVGIA